MKKKKKQSCLNKKLKEKEIKKSFLISSIYIWIKSQSQVRSGKEEEGRRREKERRKTVRDLHY